MMVCSLYYHAHFHTVTKPSRTVPSPNDFLVSTKRVAWFGQCSPSVPHCCSAGGAALLGFQKSHRATPLFSIPLFLPLRGSYAESNHIVATHATSLQLASTWPHLLPSDKSRQVNHGTVLIRYKVHIFVQQKWTT